MASDAGEYYHRQAEDCLRLAEHAGSPDLKSLLMTMAGAWHRLAQDRENIGRCAEGVGATRGEAASPYSVKKSDGRE
jgi:hypothetical protein